MSEFDAFMSQSRDGAEEVFGTKLVEFEDEAAPVKVDWNTSGTRQELEVHGEIVSFTATIIVRKSRLVNPPRLNQRVVSKDGVNYVISGTLAEDEQDYTLALDSTDVAQP